MSAHDYLIQALTEKTGTTFKVLRRKIQVGQKNGPNGVVLKYGYRYALRAIAPPELASEHFDGYTFRFCKTTGLTQREMSAYLATLIDMIDMGFIKAAKQ